VLRKHEIWKKKRDIGVTLGYYGEEIETVVLEPSFVRY
jgi:hypothetical protein